MSLVYFDKSLYALFKWSFTAYQKDCRIQNFHFIQISLFAWQLICMFGGPVKIKSISVKT